MLRVEVSRNNSCRDWVFMILGIKSIRYGYEILGIVYLMRIKK